VRPVVWSADAHRHALEVLRYIANNNPDAAERVVDAIEQAGQRLGEFLTGRHGRVAGMYEKSLDRLPYIVAYELRTVEGPEAVVILRIIHTAREWPDEQWP
jgi:plasmid stabilization system protein ParE